MDNQEFIDECLREHNKYRQLHGVNPLRHSINLDKSAQEWADDLITKDHLQNSPISSKGEVGENISSRSSSAAKVTLSGVDVAKQWYCDIKNYDFTKSSGAAGNFTQVIWKSTEEVGFGVAHLKGKCVVVAHYRPAGNVKGNYVTNVLPLISGEGCAVAAVGSGSCDNTNIECPQLSVLKEEWTDVLTTYKTPSSHQRTDSMSSDDHFELQLHNDSEFEKATKRQLREFVRDTLSAINKYRTLHGVPILKHNKELDVLSQQFAEELSLKSTLSNSNNKYKGDRVGENIASRWSNGRVEYSAKDVVDHWYSENGKFTFGKEPPNVQGIGNFTQMLWKSSKEVGIGKAFMTKGKDSRVIIVCNYYPAGNVMGRFVENVLPASH